MMTIPGWAVAYDGDGLYIATRQAKLTEYQGRYGALAEVDARCLEELRALVDAQTELARRLEAAERATVRVRHLQAAE